MSDQRDSRLETKLDKVVDKITLIEITMARNTASLEEHVKRSNMIEAKLAPVERHVAMIQGGVKFLTILGVIIGAYLKLKSI